MPAVQTRSACCGGGCGGKRVERPRGPTTAYIALGSNLGDRVGWIEKACAEMDRRGIKVKRTSSLWETEPMYVLDQDRFVNGACEVVTDLEPLALLDELQDIERTLGRQKLIDKGPRNIDLDILMYGDEKIEHPRLNVPHIGIPEREFVLRPLAELIPHKPLYASNPWKLTLDYLNELPPAAAPLSPLTPISAGQQALVTLTPTRKTHVMAIINATPDSFSDGGVHTPDNLISTLQSFAKAGATMIDIGGASTSPGRPDVSAEEEISRVLPVIKLVRSLPELSHLAVSVDTWRASVAEAAVAAGADIINDVSAGQLDPDMLPYMARSNRTVCLMHMRGTPRTMQSLTDYPDGIIPTMARELLDRVAEAEAAGVRRWRIILDPGLGFAKTAPQNLEILRHMDELRSWPGLEGLPWLIGSSRKTFIGKVLGVVSPQERIWGTAATVVSAVQSGADIVRVHDAVEMCQVAKMADAIYRQ
ncbi:Folic acid synthesis protein fol1 [Colletotrichum fructicola]|uniref:Folic acid synthesis protein FOL1 n=1 Tax=Colletotrichum fructicola (strain Nara gc5) TaxID=1213859 RepID=A0A7J6JDU2_COLFN|nr:Folic acid synthesis protein [Colletotrichum fructicola]KAF4487005.1 Folic acid synthesis protein fol1 [Colletotrichum fructicola Nara gc5]KAI8273590.1 Folic acid synthesis protein [Colletotrichum sp. SAR11_57]KAE9575761.1 Folic acid synthesis protein [Colletotrichum fructicola]KAF4424215.1 Folic acid synthesis protein fol1 [Colletotrichum fructicola]KAF4885473.1 Folic acid synthesis protein fol1 [Colletotrichum fructicola]